jgi:hypothetical protein
MSARGHSRFASRARSARTVPTPSARACPASVPNTRPMPQPLIATSTHLLAPAKVNVIRPSVPKVFSRSTTPYPRNIT